MIRGISSSSYILLLTILFLLSACNGNIAFTDSRQIKGNVWNVNDIVKFPAIITDTINSNNVNFIIRTGSSYPFRNIYLFVTTTSPNGNSITDTLHYNLADEKGKWYGKGFGDINELNLPYKSNVYFPRKGTYTFAVQHGMRIMDLRGVFDFGIRIEKIKK
jgi:gliding motility-associated lipoprotein GldH